MVKLTCTDYQAEIIKQACELYGRVQIGQFGDLAETICRRWQKVRNRQIEEMGRTLGENE